MTTRIATLLAAALALPGAARSQELLIYGGKKLDVFLGSLTAPEWEEESVWSAKGKYGYRAINDTSVWSSFSAYGGRFGDYSPFNRNAKHPPALFDASGRCYGYFTVDDKHAERTRLRIARLVLAYWETIKQDVPAFYDAFFLSEDLYEGPRPMLGKFRPRH